MPLVGYQEKYCSKECQFTYQYNESIRKWKNGEWDGTVAFKPSNIIRRYMLEKYKCSKCGWGEVNPYTNLVPLQIPQKVKVHIIVKGLVAQLNRASLS